MDSKSVIQRLLRRAHSLATTQPRELDVLAAYAEWSHAYPARAHNALMRAEQNAMLALAPDPRGKIALDLGCGTGRYALLLRERGAAHVVACDLSPDMLAHADKRSADFFLADLVQLPISENYFDLTLCGLAVGHIQDLRSALAEMARVLKRGGVLIYSDFHPLGSLAGWRREFNGRDGKRRAVQHFAHLYSDHDTACRAAGLRIAKLQEPIIGTDIVEEFPGSDQVYRRWNGWPAALVIRAEKP